MLSASGAEGPIKELGFFKVPCPSVVPVPPPAAGAGPVRTARFARCPRGGAVRGPLRRPRGALGTNADLPPRREMNSVMYPRQDGK